MAALPPRLGRLIIREIMTPRKFDYSKLDAECERMERELARIGRIENDEKSVRIGK